MAHIVSDRVRETSTTTGTGTYSLAGAVSGYQAFDDDMATNDTCWYVAHMGANWEVGLGTFTSAGTDTLARTTILASSNADAAVDWGAGTKHIFLTVPAAKWGQVAAGAAATPSHSFYDDTDTGMYRSAANTLGFATNGTERISISSAGVVSVTNTTDASAIGTASVVLAGGLSVEKQLRVGTDVTLSASAAVLTIGTTEGAKLRVGRTSAIGGTGAAGLFEFHSGGTTANGIQVNDQNTANNAIYAAFFANGTLAGSFLHRTGATGFSIQAEGILGLRAGGSTDAIVISTAQIVSIPNTTDSTNTTTGALTVAGGLGVAKQVYALGLNTLATSAVFSTFSTSAASNNNVVKFDTSGSSSSIGLWLTNSNSNVGAVMRGGGQFDFYTGGTSSDRDSGTLRATISSAGLTLFKASGGTALTLDTTGSGQAVISYKSVTAAQWDLGVGAGDGSANFNIYSALSGTTGIRVSITNAGAVRFNSISTTGSAANAFLDSGDSNNLLRSTSSLRYKHDLRDVSLAEARRITMGLRPMFYRSLAAADDPDRWFCGLGAEDVFKVAGDSFVHMMDGEPDGVMYDRVGMLTLAMVQDHDQAIESLTRELSALRQENAELRQHRLGN